MVAAMLPGAAEIERVPCSTPGYAPDLLATLAGTGTARVLLLGHLDTVDRPRRAPAARARRERLVGSGTVDMKGGVALALGVMRVLAEMPDGIRRAHLLAVNDEEWRTGEFAHGPRFAGHDACLCFEAGERGPDGEDAVVARRKAAGTLRVIAHGVAAHSGSPPSRAATRCWRSPRWRGPSPGSAIRAGPERLTAVPTVLARATRSTSFPPTASWSATCARTDSMPSNPVLEAIPPSVDGVELEAELVRRWPGMDTREQVARAAARPGRVAARPAPARVGERGGASDASHLAQHVPLTADGLGPRGGKAHHPDEFVLARIAAPTRRGRARRGRGGAQPRLTTPDLTRPRDIIARPDRQRRKRTGHPRSRLLPRRALDSAAGPLRARGRAQLRPAGADDRGRSPGQLHRHPGEHPLRGAAVPAPRAHREGLRDGLLRHPRRGRPGARVRRAPASAGARRARPSAPARGRRARPTAPSTRR